MSEKTLAIIRVILFVLLYIAIGIGLSFAAGSTSQIVSLYLTIAQVVLPILLVVAFRRWLDKKTVASLGLETEKGWLRDLILGMAVGIILISAIFAIEYFAGWVSVTVHFGIKGMSGFFIVSMIVFLLLMFLVAVSEELVFRGYILQNLGIGGGLLVGVIGSSILFGLAHSLNPGFTWLIGLNLILAGLFLGYSYVVTGSLWFPIGWHLTWNYFQGYVFGLPVSGMNLGMLSLLISKDQGPVWLTGGAFGPEGGLIATAALLAGFLFLWLFYARMVRPHAGTSGSGDGTP